MTDERSIDPPDVDGPGLEEMPDDVHEEPVEAVGSVVLP